VTVADVFYEDCGEIRVGDGGCEGAEGLGDFEPLDGGLAYDYVAEVEGAVIGREDGGSGSGEIDVGGTGCGSGGDAEDALSGSGLGWGEGDDYGAGGVSGERDGTVGGVGEVAGEGEGQGEWGCACVADGDGLSRA